MSEKDVDGSSSHADAPQSGSFDGEDFLFHLYRGSELLQDNLVEAAKEELEAALSMQPRDVEGQGLLGVVYFRLGHYPRAIKIYEELRRLHPAELPPKVNLALCYLKTGQFGEARGVLEDVVTRDPTHRRAWGYLGLVYERLDDYNKAQAAFERADQPRLAQRMADLGGQAEEPSDSNAPGRAELQAAVEHAVHELDDEGGPMPFSLAGEADPDAPPPSRSGRWRAIELGEERLPPPGRPLKAAAVSLGRRRSVPPPNMDELGPPSAVRGSVPAPAMGVLLPPTPTQLAREALLIFPEEPRVVMHADGVVLVRVDGWFAARASRIRALTTSGGPLVSKILSRRARGRDLEEPLGGIAAPLVALEGRGHLVLGAAEGRRVIAIAIRDEFLYVREDHLVGFEQGVHHESGRLPMGDGEFVPMTQLSGHGTAVIETRRLVESLEVASDHVTVLRGAHVVGWAGRLIPRAVPAGEAPAGVRGFVAFSGTGVVFVDAS